MVDGSEIDLHHSEGDVYCMLNTLQGSATYTWISNLQTSGNNVIDLSTMTNSANKATIGFPDDAIDGYADLGGWEGNYENIRFLDSDYFEAGISGINLYYPPSSFQFFRTYLEYYEENYEKRWSHYSYVSTPSAFRKINADYTYLTTSPDNFQILTTGTFVIGRSRWLYNSNERRYSWAVISPQDETSYKLPLLSDAVKQLYPDINRSMFEFNSMYIRDYLGLNSYNEYLQLIFNSSTPYEQGVKEVYQIRRYDFTPKNKNSSVPDHANYREKR